LGYIGQAPANKVVKTADIEDNAVTSAKIDTDTIAAGDLAANSVDSSELVDGSIDTSHIGALQVTDAKIAAMAASKLTGALPAISGASLTSLNATNLGSGTVPTARLGSGSASSSVFLSGANTWIGAGGGKMGQFLSTTKTDTFGIVSDSAWTSITGFSVDITPSATSSKIWIWYHLERSNYSNTQNMSTRLRRDSTVIGVGTAAGSRHVVTTGPYKAENNYNMPNTHGFLDSPSSTSAITYDVQILGNGSAQQINYYGSDSDTAFSGRSVSTISVMEVLA
jgi:hypothetical protein